MSHLPTIWEAVKTALVGLVDHPPDATTFPTGWPGVPLKGVAEGEQMSVAGDPFVFMINDNFDRPPFGGADKMVTKWRFTLRLTASTTSDGPNAEKLLMPLAEQVMAAFEAHTKLGLPDIVAGTEVRDGDWGYVMINEIFYRSLDIHLEVTEKSLASRAA